MADLVPLFSIITVIVAVLIVAELVDRNRIKHKGDTPSSVYERREKMNPYTMPMGARVKPGMSYSGNPDYSLPIPESLDDSDDPNRKRE